MPRRVERTGPTGWMAWESKHNYILRMSWEQLWNIRERNKTLLDSKVKVMNALEEEEKVYYKKVDQKREKLHLEFTRMQAYKEVYRKYSYRRHREKIESSKCLPLISGSSLVGGQSSYNYRNGRKVRTDDDGVGIKKNSTFVLDEKNCIRQDKVGKVVDKELNGSLPQDFKSHVFQPEDEGYAKKDVKLSTSVIVLADICEDAEGEKEDRKDKITHPQHPEEEQENTVEGHQEDKLRVPSPELSLSRPRSSFHKDYLEAVYRRLKIPPSDRTSLLNSRGVMNFDALEVKVKQMRLCKHVKAIKEQTGSRRSRVLPCECKSIFGLPIFIQRQAEDVYEQMCTRLKPNRPALKRSVPYQEQICTVPREVKLSWRPAI